MANNTLAAQSKTFTSYAGTIVREYSNVSRPATLDEIPVISLKQPEAKILEQLEYAVTKAGFFYVEDHGVPSTARSNLIKGAKAFFAMNESTKLQYDIRTTKNLRGYECFNINNIEPGLEPDINEQFNWGYDAKFDPDSGSSSAPIPSSKENSMNGGNRWPSETPLEEVVSEYMSYILVLARKLARYFAIILGVPEDFFKQCLAQPGCMGRIIHYPSQSPSENALGIGAHTDFECFTILMTDLVPALQILSGTGEWIMAPPRENSFVINIGDLLARWSNDKFLSTIHRVLNVSGQERYSVPVFIGPSYDTVITPLETCIEEGKKSPYEPITAGEYVYARIREGRNLDD